MSKATQNDKVRVHYTGRLDDGSVFDTSREAGPLEFTLGSHHVIAGFEAAVKEMGVGEKKTVRIPASEAYGPRREDLVIKVERSKFPPHIKPEIGLHLQITQPGGTILNVLISEITEDSITLDANHPFSGKDLTFDLELVEIEEAAAEM